MPIMAVLRPMGHAMRVWHSLFGKRTATTSRPTKSVFEINDSKVIGNGSGFIKYISL